MTFKRLKRLVLLVLASVNSSLSVIVPEPTFPFPDAVLELLNGQNKALGISEQCKYDYDRFVQLRENPLLTMGHNRSGLWASKSKTTRLFSFWECTILIPFCSVWCLRCLPHIRAVGRFIFQPGELLFVPGDNFGSFRWRWRCHNCQVLSCFSHPHWKRQGTVRCYWAEHWANRSCESISESMPRTTAKLEKHFFSLKAISRPKLVSAFHPPVEWMKSKDCWIVIRLVATSTCLWAVSRKLNQCPWPMETRDSCKCSTSIRPKQKA